MHPTRATRLFNRLVLLAKIRVSNRVFPDPRERVMLTLGAFLKSEIMRYIVSRYLFGLCVVLLTACAPVGLPATFTPAPTDTPFPSTSTLTLEPTDTPQSTATQSSKAIWTGAATYVGSLDFYLEFDLQKWNELILYDYFPALTHKNIPTCFLVWLPSPRDDRLSAYSRKEEGVLPFDGGTYFTVQFHQDESLAKVIYLSNLGTDFSVFSDENMAMCVHDAEEVLATFQTINPTPFFRWGYVSHWQLKFADEKWTPVEKDDYIFWD